MGSESAIEAVDLVKHFGPIKAVDGISCEVPHGASFGFLGPNGAGKTTVMRLICCLSVPTRGWLRVLGMDPGKDARKIKQNIGIVPQHSNLDEDLTVQENLMLFAQIIPKKL